MDKYLFNDLVAMAVSLLVGLIAGVLTLIVNPFFAFYWPLGTGIVIALLVFMIYVFVLRKTDKQIEMEKSLMRTADMAQRIGDIASDLPREYSSQRKEIGQISVGIAMLGDKIIRRELDPLEVQINHLERLASTFVGVLDVLTGEVRYSRVRMEEELGEVIEEHIPKTQNAIEQLEVAIDKSKARRRARAEADLEVITALYEHNQTAQEAAEKLRNLMTESY